MDKDAAFAACWMMTLPALFLSAFIPAFCEEAIRSSYLFYLGDRGSRRTVVLSICAVFIIGEMIYDASVFPSAQAEFGSAIAIPLFAVAIITGTLLHLALTLWSAERQWRGLNIWRVFASALSIHFIFNLIAIAAIGVMI
ncbi:MAG: hypothetical protein AAFV59_02795 [Pseudomonadota bacterium]